MSARNLALYFIIVSLKFTDTAPVDTVLIQLDQETGLLKGKITDLIDNISVKLGTTNARIQQTVNDAEYNIGQQITKVQQYIDEAKKVALETGGTVQICTDSAVRELDSNNWNILSTCRVDTLPETRIYIGHLKNSSVAANLIISNCQAQEPTADENLQICVRNQVEQVANLALSLEQECLAGFNNAVKVTSACVQALQPRLSLICESIARHFKSCAIEELEVQLQDN